MKFLNPTIYNFYVPLWKRICIAISFKISLDIGGRVLWKLAPYSMVG